MYFCVFYVWPVLVPKCIKFNWACQSIARPQTSIHAHAPVKKFATQGTNCSPWHRGEAAGRPNTEAAKGAVALESGTPHDHAV